jgi:AI-2 transport protein TqsA
MDPSGDTSATVPSEAPSTKKDPLGALSGASSLAAIIATTVAIGLLLFITHWAAPLLAPLGLGAMIAALASPLFGRFVGKGRSPTVAMVITVGVVVLIGGALVAFSIYSSHQLTQSLALYATQISAQYPKVAEALAAIGVPGAMADLISPEAMVSLLESVASAVGEVGGNLAVAVVLAALLLLDAPRIARLTGSGIGSQNPIFREYPAVAQSAITYFVIRIRVNLLTAGGLLVVMLLLGVDDAFLWAVGTFFLSFVPYVGLVIALIPPVILAFAESGPAAALIIIIAGAILNVVAENVLEPSMTGKALKLSTWLVFVMFFFTVWLIGPVGSLLAMPITVLLVLVLQGNPNTRWLAALMTREDTIPEPDPEASPAATPA